MHGRTGFALQSYTVVMSVCTGTIILAFVHARDCILREVDGRYDDSRGMRGRSGPTNFLMASFILMFASCASINFFLMCVCVCV